MQEPLQLQRRSQIGKLKKTQAVAVAEVDNLSTYRLFIKDVSTGQRYLVDTGANVSVLPATVSEKRNLPPSNYLYAANGTQIPAFGERTIVLNFGMRRPYKWRFVIATVSRPILGADFLHHYALMVDLHGRRLVDQKTNISTAGIISPTYEGSIRTIDNNLPYHDLLAKYPDITRPNSSKLSNSEVEHYIETTGPPLYAKPRPLPPHKYNSAKEEIQLMMEQGICRPSKSPWASPLHMVLKKDGKYRLCGDYRRLNAVTIPDRYPIPRLHDFTYNLQGKKIFSKIDLQKAYYQIQNREEDIKKTAVITPFGLYEFTRMCFGLRNAGQTFQRHIDSVLRGLPVFPFVDDILVASVNENEHRKHLQDVFQRLNDNGLQINAAKCIFGQSQLDFLGYSISSEGISPTEEKTKAIKAYPLPITIQDLRRFIGMLNFYRLNIPHAAEHQKELSKYFQNAKKNDKTKIQWSEEAKVAFSQCKRDIENAILISYPSHSEPFAIMTDASNTCAGAVIQQRIKGKWRPLGFFSKKLSEAQQKYSTYDRELLSIYMAVRHFRRVFEGRELVIYTDHKPLTHALTASGTNETPRRTRYLEYIGQFTSNIKHINGKDNQVADALSRVETITCPTPIDYEELAKKQAEDKELERMRKTGKYVFKSILMPNARTHIICETSTSAAARPYLPLFFRRTAYQAIHDLSHPGIRATRKLVTARYFWPSMNSDINNWTRTCDPCQRAKVQQHTNSPIASFKQTNRLEHVHIDLVGPLPTSNGYRYLLTMIDRTTRWPEACPLEDITAEKVASALYEHWIARFGCPVTITTDQGRQFESELFKKLMYRMGIHRTRTTAYHPQCNGMIERWHRSLKAALTARMNSTTWALELPTVLLGLRASIKEDIGASTAELLYGQPLRLPGEFYDESTRYNDTTSRMMHTLSEALKKAQAQRKSSNHRAIFIHDELHKCSHVYLRHDASTKPLTPTYDGPYEVIARNDKYYNIQLHNRRANIAIDRLKPAFRLNTESEATAHVPVPTTYAYITKSGRKSRPTVRFH